ncbi:hypothetical protein MNBD_GAMMA12-1862 [hydrothermal vent metagenome]|uniref:Uncharacterized protein n=1 Tax=hydrothermal vent metagenome TaxID=652676 RepID=A0A3B0Y9D8_9ZZZZ
MTCQVKKFLTILFAITVIASPIFAGVRTGIDKVAKLPYWELNEKGIRFRLVQRLPDQIRAFFLKRGFSLKYAELIAQSCVFQTVFHNQALMGSKQNITYDQNQWVLLRGKIKSKMKTREDWGQFWAATSVKMSAKIAFKWSMLPSKQIYQPEDHNWGLSIFNFKPGVKFSLKMSWRQGNVLKTKIIPNIICAPDIHPEPK